MCEPKVHKVVASVCLNYPALIFYFLLIKLTIYSVCWRHEEEKLVVEPRYMSMDSTYASRV